MKFLSIFGITVVSIFGVVSLGSAECGECNNGDCVLGCPIDAPMDCGACEDQGGTCAGVTGSGCGSGMNADGTAELPTFAANLARQMAEGSDDARLGNVFVRSVDDRGIVRIHRPCDGAVVHVSMPHQVASALQDASQHITL